MNKLVESAKLDKTAISFSTLDEVERESDYWLTRSPQESIAALELLRAIHNGYDPATARLQRVLEVDALDEG